MMIGRKPEQKELLEAANSEYSKFVAVYGRRRGNFIDSTQTKKAVHITLITPYGLKQNSHSAIAQNEILMASLFNR